MYKESNGFEKYFKDYKEYSFDTIVDSEYMLKEGGHYTYIASTFLNGLINYIKPMKVYVIDRYSYEEGNEMNSRLDTIELHIQYKSTSEWKNIEFKTKLEAIDFLNTSENEYRLYHTKLNMFRDDVLFLGKTENYYWFFWFDMDVSDCSICRFKTDDDINTVETLFTEFCKSKSETQNIYEFKKEWIKGWISF